MNLFMDVIGLESCSGLLEGILSESSNSTLQSSMAKGIPLSLDSDAIDWRCINMSCRIAMAIVLRAVYIERPHLLCRIAPMAAYLRLVV